LTFSKKVRWTLFIKVIDSKLNATVNLVLGFKCGQISFRSQDWSQKFVHENSLIYSVGDQFNNIDDDKWIRHLYDKALEFRGLCPGRSYKRYLSIWTEKSATVHFPYRGYALALCSLI